MGRPPGSAALVLVDADDLRCGRGSVNTTLAAGLPMSHLAARLPAAVLADLLTIHAIPRHLGSGVEGGWSIHDSELVKAPIANHAE